ncbi:uncharacterized protein A1O9_00834 [Exophiala aquamarina CBS 119918]|uniref:Ubiquitin thioesterase OTU n=1 Tax=Exophiala aquamarina CBS 119918 TaxID=1182545 RepID=A0A072PSM2_9EURO|nr:uncharacterized protein A1O9_00834 [Exophiala aquamarina CBS 119918]KEF62861.1 hypothetical protein A1O9_00834 [Exophiala aquamarina CBS 119918]
MRIRIRDPTGKSSIISLGNSATIETLREAITTETSLTSFEIKYGFPPKTLDLNQYPPASILSELDVKLNGEQLIVNNISPSASQQKSEAARQPTSPKEKHGSSQSPSTAAQPKSKPKPQQPAAAPLSLSRKKNPAMDDPPEVFMPEVGGTLVLRIMPDDNSCLFRAVASAAISELDAVTELRSVIAQTIHHNPEKYSKAILDDKEPEAYCRWIQTEDAWGGQIELDILSQHFDIEICSIDVQTLRVDRYNEQASRRCFVVYSGIHYDTIALSPFENPVPEQDIKQFPAPLSDEILQSAVTLCERLQARHYYTDTAGFQLRCNDCGATCIGEAGATKHAERTGHYNFGEAS